MSEPLARPACLDSCAVSDAMDKLHLTGVVTGLQRLSTTRRIVGRAVTVKLGVGGAHAGPARHLGTTAVEARHPGDVIVIEQRSGIDAGSWGGHDFPVFARAATARTARGRIVELATQGPVSIGDVDVTLGDYVIADGSAVVFIRVQDIERVLDAAEMIARREALMAKALLGGSPITEVMGASYEDMLKR